MNWMALILIGQAWAAGGGAHGDSHGVPWGAIFVQGFNLTVLLVLLFVLLRKTVTAHFANRAAEYHQMVSKAEAARTAAELGRQAIKERLDKLEAEAARTVERAKSEAAELRSRMSQEAKAVAQRLEVEAARTATVELEKAKAELRRELLNSALQSSRESMKSNISVSEQQKLQREFADKIQVVGG